MYTPNGECCELSIPNIFAKAVYQRDRRADRNFRRGQSLLQYSCQIICIKTRSRRKIMFVPLPVPFVFQRTAPDLNAWRLKSPLALRSNSGKIFFCLFSLLSASHPPCRSGLAVQTRPTLHGADARAAAKALRHTPTLHTAHRLPRLRLWA